MTELSGIKSNSELCVLVVIMCICKSSVDLNLLGRERGKEAPKVVLMFFLGCYKSAQKSNQDGFGS